MSLCGVEATRQDGARHQVKTSRRLLTICDSQAPLGLSTVCGVRTTQHCMAISVVELLCEDCMVFS